MLRLTPGCPLKGYINMKSVKLLFKLMALMAIGSAVAFADVPPMINYQGKILTPAGAAVADTAYVMQFAIYDAPVGGTQLWSEPAAPVQVKKGLFSVLLGSVNNLGPNLFNAPNRFLGVKVGADAEMTPRQQIVSSAFAFKAATADVAATAVNALMANTVADGAITAAKLAPNSVNMSNMGVDWTDFTPIFGGFSAAPSGGFCKWCKIGKVVFFTYSGGCGTGTSNDTTFTITLPIAPSLGNFAAVYPILTYDNGSWVQGGGAIQLLTGTTTAQVFKTNSLFHLGPFTASGQKDAVISIFYPVD